MTAPRLRSLVARSLTATLVAVGYLGCMPNFDGLSNHAGQGDSGGAATTSGSSGSAGSHDCAATSNCADPPKGGTTAQGGDNSDGGKAGITATAGAGGTGGRGGSGGVTSMPPEGGAGGDDPGSDGGRGGGPTGIDPPILRVDFERDAENFILSGPASPVDCLDKLLQSLEAAHHGSGALAMTFDGMFTPITGNPFYGFQSDKKLPAVGKTLTLWMMATEPGVSVEVFLQVAPNFTWIALVSSNNAVLTPNTWLELSATIPDENIVRYGAKLYSPLDYQGTVYVDDISW